MSDERAYDPATLLEMAMVDALTGLPNRRALEEAARHAIREAREDGSPLCIALADVDLFKTVNDRFGHAAGDECLRRVARAFRDSSAPGDLVGRHGGEEFLAILRGCTLSEAIGRAERLRKAVAELELPFDVGGGLPLSVSIGVAALAPDAPEPYANALAAADAALYRAKELGRDCVVTSGSLVERRTATGVAASPLPRLRNPIFGRDALIDELRTLIEREQLVTLCGPGGCGKTTLAIAAAEGLVARYPQGVAFLDFTGLERGELVAVRVAERFGIRAPDEAHAVSALRTFLRNQRILLLFDCCERVIDGVARLLEGVLPARRDVRVIATSRQPLHVSAEHVVAVPPLDDASAADVFEARARLTAERFDAGDRAEILEICRRLDNLPLAIELAAAHGAKTSIRELSAAIVRAPTIHALYDLSYARLPEPERRFFRSLSAFAGGWTLSAAAEVAEEEPDAALDVLTSLADKSLVVVVHSREAGHRFALLDSAREYAGMCARESGETNEFERRHARYFARRAARAYAQWASTPTESWLAPLRRDLENFRRALTFAVAEPVEGAIDPRLSLAPLWHDLGLLHEGVENVDGLLASDTLAPRLRAEAYLWRARFASMLSQHAELLASAQRAAELARAIGHEHCLVVALASAAIAHCFLQDDFALARRQLEEALQTARTIAFPFGIAFAELGFGFAALMQGELEAALRHHEAALADFRAIGKLDGIVRSLLAVGATHVIARRPREGLVAYEEALAIVERLNNVPMLAAILANVADCRIALGDYDAAYPYAMSALRLNETIGNRVQTAHTFGVLAELGIRSGRNVAIAVRLLAFERAEYAGAKMPHHPKAELQHAELLAAARERIGETACNDACASGSALTRDAALELADDL
ncbi:MAG TPA: diguanylate cyclase [Verrucomicrobiae bacterium]|nr:diguanylate cyclase [Verrucomicrobiae bacterium]